MLRRAFLTLLGLAPVAAAVPALADVPGTGIIFVANDNTVPHKAFLELLDVYKSSRRYKDFNMRVEWAHVIFDNGVIAEPYALGFAVTSNRIAEGSHVAAAKAGLLQLAELTEQRAILPNAPVVWAYALT